MNVTLSGFNKVTRKDVKVSGGDRVAVPTIQLQPGGVNETVDVKADIPILQTASGERSDVVTSDQLREPAVAANDQQRVPRIREFPSWRPAGGGGSEGRLGGGGEDNIMVDGVSNMDTGNNGLMSGLDIPVDSIAEVRVETSGYQAEFGRSSGLQVSAVTKSGTNRFHGIVLRHREQLEVESQLAGRIVANGIAKPRAKSRFFGYSDGRSGRQAGRQQQAVLLLRAGISVPP